MAKVVAKEFRNDKGYKSVESLDSLLRRFKRKVANEGIIQSLKEQEYYVSHGQQRRLEKEAAIRRIQRNNAKQQLKEDVLAGKVHLSKTQTKKLGLGGKR